MAYTDTRIAKLRTYLFEIVDTLTNDSKYQINANMLSNDINNYSLDKIPTDVQIEKWIIGNEIHRDVFSFRSRMAYSQDTINNLKNIGFFESFEQKIRENNEQGILPNIENVESIECLNCGTMLVNDSGNSSIFDIQIQVTYRDSINEGGASLWK